jgi:hypothetical protein
VSNSMHCCVLITNLVLTCILWMMASQVSTHFRVWNPFPVGQNWLCTDFLRVYGRTYVPYASHTHTYTHSHTCPASHWVLIEQMLTLLIFHEKALGSTPSVAVRTHPLLCMHIFHHGHHQDDKSVITG